MERKDWYHVLPTRVQKIMQRLERSGYIAWLVGGAVRDMLLDEKPKDFDIVTNATPKQVAELFPRTVAVGAHFGVMIVVESGEPTEVATFRKEGAYLDSRHPSQIEFATPEEDSKRRDFTINGLYWDPSTGKIIDYVGGLEDIEARVIRTIGRASARFQEDALRTLRAFRFHAQLAKKNFTLDKNLLTGIKRQGHLILEISKERITEECLYILKCPKPSLAFAGMKSTKMFDRLFPQLRGITNDQFDHLLYVVDHLEQGWREAIHGRATIETYLQWAAFLQFIPDAPNSVRNVSCLCLGKNDSRSIRRVLQWLQVIPTIEHLPIYRIKEFLAMEEYFSTIALYLTNCRLIKDSSFEFLQSKRREYLNKGTLNPDPLLTGNDLIDMGIEPSPKFKSILETIRNEQLEEKIHTREEALALVSKLHSN